MRWYRATNTEEFKSWLRNNSADCEKYMGAEEYKYWIDEALGNINH